MKRTPLNPDLAHRNMSAILMALLLWAAPLAPALALDIDEKLTLRLLKISSSKRTVLINRGIEDGLAVGDHAKFYLTTGMVARGVVVKVSPARSVWSIYRIIDPASLVENKVLNLKIATPVKITPDPSKMIMVEPVATPGEDIPISPDAQDLQAAAQASSTPPTDSETAEIDATEMAAMEGPSLDIAPGDLEEAASPAPRKRPGGVIWEAVGLGHFNSLSGKVDSNNPAYRNSGALGSYDLSLGLESYFFIPSWQQLSLQAFVNMGKSDILNVDHSSSLESSFIGLGVALNYHFSRHPREQKKPIAYANLGGGAGRAQDKSSTSSNDSNGNAFFMQLGAGVKYYMGQWGGQVQLDYYLRRETYLFEDNSGPAIVEEERIKTLSGPRLALGLLYRF